MSTDRSTPPPSDGLKLPSWLVIVLVVGVLGFAWWKNHNSSIAPVTNSVVESQAPSVERSNARRSSEILPDENEPTTPETFPAERHDASSTATPTATNETETPDASRTTPDRNRTTGPLTNHRDKSKPGSNHKPTETQSERMPKAPGNAADPSYKVENQSIRDLNGKVVFKGTIDLRPTIDRIERGESNRHRNDGTSFQNREGRLPRKPNGYYKEYVHPTPGENGPGPQRIIIGEDGEIWYTPDHYKSFKQIKAESK